MNLRVFLRGTVAFGSMAAVILAAIIAQEGIHGLIPFYNMEALVLVFGCALLALWVTYPLGEIAEAFFAAWLGRVVSRSEASRMAAILHDAAYAARAAGMVATILAMTLMLSGIEDAAQIPRRMALALTNLFYAFGFSEFVVSPLARRLLRSLDAAPSAPR